MKNLYIEANTPAIVENCITAFLWHNTPPFDTINKSCIHAREFNYCSPSDLRVSVSSMLDNVLLTYDDFMTFVKSRRSSLISPATKSAADYIGVMWEQKDIPEKVFAYLKNNL